MSEQAERRWYRRGDVVTLTAIVHNTWTDADARRRKGDDGERVQLLLPSGGMVIVPAADLAGECEREAVEG